jgi:hypothetical protein
VLPPESALAILKGSLLGLAAARDRPADQLTLLSDLD